MAYSLHIHALRVSNCTTVVVQNRTWYDEKDDRTLVREAKVTAATALPSIRLLCQLLGLGLPLLDASRSVQPRGGT